MKDMKARKERCRELVALFGRAPIKKTFGMSLRYDEECRAVFHLPYNPDLDHFLGGVHGGVISTLLDNAGWFTAATLSDNWVATAEMQVRLLEPAARVALRSTARIVKAGKRLIVAEMEVRAEPDNSLIAIGSATFIVTSMSAKRAKV